MVKFKTIGIATYNQALKLGQCVWQIFLAFWLSQSFDIVWLLMVENLPKIIRTFDGRNFCETKTATTKPFKNFENRFCQQSTVIFEILDICPKSRSIKWSQWSNFDICWKSQPIKWSQWSNLGQIWPKFSTSYQTFWLLTKNGWFLTVENHVKRDRKFRLFYFAKGGRILQKSTKVQKSYWNAWPYLKHIFIKSTVVTARVELYVITMD